MMMRGLIFLSISLLSIQANALSWWDLWYTSDQQGQYLMDKGQFAKAKDKFTRIDWAAAAAYKAGDYKRAADQFKELKTEQGYYNQGNAFAHMGKYEQAIEAYDKAIAIDPVDQDAMDNKKLVSDLLKKDKEKEQTKSQDSKRKKNKDKQDQQKQDQTNQDQQNQDQQKQDQQKQDQQKQDQQKPDQQNQDQQNQDQQKQKKQGDVQSEAEQEQQQAKEQWLRLIPDDPGGLIREKFLRDHLRRERGWYQ